MAETRYWLKLVTLPWQEATKEQFVQAERAAGFRSTSGQADEPATGGFSGGGIQGTITYGRITGEKYGWDPEFLAAAKKARRRREKQTKN